MKQLDFDPGAWQELLWWAQNDPKTLKRILLLLDDIQKNGNTGIGKPEALRFDFTGFWSRRITQEHRLVYRIVGDTVEVASCRYHYQ